MLCTRFVYYRQLRGAWMVYMSIGNHSTDARNCQAGKTVIGIIKVPPKRSSDPQESYRYCSRFIYQAWWDCILSVMGVWEQGFYLYLPGADDPVVLRPRLGLLLGDLLEMRMIAGTSSSYSVRCYRRVMNRDAGAGVEGDLAADDEAARAPAGPVIAEADDDVGADSDDGEGGEFEDGGDNVQVDAVDASDSEAEFDLAAIEAVAPRDNEVRRTFLVCS
jgi:hypothetical protein